MRPEGVHGFPINFSKRDILGKPLDQVGICDVGTAERYKICQTFRDKAIAAITVHLHVRDQCACEEGAEMPEHAIVGQSFEWRSSKVGCVAHEQQVRKIVGTQLPDRIFSHWQSFIVGLKCRAFVHRADLDSHPLCIDLIQDRLDYFEEEARAIFQVSAVLVLAQVGRSVQELRDQIEIVREDLDAIEAGFHRIPRSAPEICNRNLNLLFRQRPRFHCGLPSRRGERQLAGIDIRCGHGLRAVQ